MSDLTPDEIAEIDRTFEPYRIVLCGSSTWADAWTPRAMVGVKGALELNLLHSTLDGLLDNAVCGMRYGKHGERLVILHGGCQTGADAVVTHWAARREGVVLEVYRAGWDIVRRNKEEAIRSLDPTNAGHFVLSAQSSIAATKAVINVARDVDVPVITLGVM